MIKPIKNNVDSRTKKDQELSDTELAKVAGGIPPRSGTPGAEI